VKETAVRRAGPVPEETNCSLCVVAAPSRVEPLHGPLLTVINDGVVGFPVAGSFIVVIDADQPGTFIAPSEHVRDLSSLSLEASGSFLAGLRRAALDLQTLCESSGITVSPLQLDGTCRLYHHGHILFHLLPTDPCFTPKPYDPSALRTSTDVEELEPRVRLVFDALHST
jgi:nitrate reductase NapAB chaperone NapD